MIASGTSDHNLDFVKSVNELRLRFALFSIQNNAFIVNA